MLDRITIVGIGNVGYSLSSTADKMITHDEFDEWLDTLSSGSDSASDELVGDEEDLIILAMHESDIVGILPQLTRALQNIQKQTIVVHTNGVAGAELLAGLRSKKRSVGAMHPFQTFGTELLPRIKNIGWGIECDDVAWPVIHSYVSELDGTPYRFTHRTRQDRLLYHAVAVVASNLTYASIDLARHLAIAAAIPVLDFVEPIVKQTLENAMNFMAEGDGLDQFPITGPLIRGETDIIEGHILALPEGERMSYALLSMALLERVKDTMDQEAVRKLHSVLLAEIQRHA